MSIDREIQRQAVSEIENCPAGTYCPAFEQGILPSVGMGPMQLDDEHDQFGFIVDKLTGNTELDDAIAAFRSRQPYWIRRQQNREIKVSSEGSH